MSSSERSKEQDDIKHYCETHQLPQLLSFLVNQLAHKKDPHPKLFSVKYFADRVSDTDLGTIGLYRSAPSEKDSACLTGGVKVLEDDDSLPFHNPFRADVTAWMSRIPPAAWLRLGEVRTATNLGALHCIRETEEGSYDEGFSMDPDAGIKALSEQCYDAFHLLYSEFFRFAGATTSAKSLLTLPGFPLNAMRERIASCLPPSSMHSAVSSVTLCFHRNFAHIPFPPTMNLSESNQVIARVRKGLEAWMALRQHTEEFTVELYSGADFFGEEGHAFRKILTREFFTLRKSYLDGGTRRRASALWLSPDKRIAVVVNWRDHLQVTVKIMDPFNAEEIAQGLQDVFALLQCIQDTEKVNDGDIFAKHRDFGYLTVEPLECRLGFRATLETRLLHSLISRSTFQELLKQAHMRKLRLTAPDELNQGLIPVSLNTLDCNDEVHIIGTLTQRLSGLLEGLKLRLPRPQLDTLSRPAAAPYRLMAPVDVTAASLAFSQLPQLLGKRRDLKSTRGDDGEKKVGALDRAVGLQALACPMGLDWWSGKVTCGFACTEDLSDYFNMSTTLTSIVEQYHSTQTTASKTATANYLFKAESSGANDSALVPPLEVLLTRLGKTHIPFGDDAVKLCVCSMRRNLHQHKAFSRATEEDLVSIQTVMVETLGASGAYAGCGISSETWHGTSDVLKFYTECVNATSRRCGSVCQLLWDTGMQVEFSNFEKAVGLSKRAEKGRGVFLSPSSDWLVAVNFNDHIYVQTHEAGGNVVKSFHKLLQLAHLFHAHMSSSEQFKDRFAFHPSLGYLTCLPEFLGTGLQFKAKLFLPYLFSSWVESAPDFKKVCAIHSFGFQHVYPAAFERGKPSTAMVWVMTTVTMGLTEMEQLEGFLDGIEAILDLEREKARRLGSPPRPPADEKMANLFFPPDVKQATYSSSQNDNKQSDATRSQELIRTLKGAPCKDFRTVFGGTLLNCVHIGRTYRFPGDLAATDVDAFKKFRSLFEGIAGKQQKSSDVLLSASSSSRALVEVFDMFQISALLDGLRKSVSLSTIQISNMCLITCRNFASIPFLPYAVAAPAFTRFNTRGLLHLAEAERAAVERLTSPRDGDPPPLAGQKYIPIPWLTAQQLSILKTKFFVDLEMKRPGTDKDILGCSYTAFDFWPRHRGVIFSADQTLVCLVNFVDHVTLLARCDDKEQLCSGIGMLRALHCLRDTLEQLETEAESESLPIAKNTDFAGFLGPNLFRSVCLATAVAAQLICPGSRAQYCNKIARWNEDYPSQLEFIMDWNASDEDAVLSAGKELQNSALVVTKAADFDHEVELLETFLKILTVVATEC